MWDFTRWKEHYYGKALERLLRDLKAWRSTLRPYAPQPQETDDEAKQLCNN